jgi:predicted transport protein
MKKLLLALMMVLAVANGWAQEPFKGMWRCDALKATMLINLAEKNITLKDFEGENTYGYLKGELNGTWVILKVKEVKDKKALVRMVSDIGYDAQDVEFRLLDNGTLEMRLVGDQIMKTIEKGKYVKMPKVSTFTSQRAGRDSR